MTGWDVCMRKRNTLSSSFHRLSVPLDMWVSCWLLVCWHLPDYLVLVSFPNSFCIHWSSSEPLCTIVCGRCRGLVLLCAVVYFLSLYPVVLLLLVHVCVCSFGKMSGLVFLHVYLNTCVFVFNTRVVNRVLLGMSTVFRHLGSVN